MYQLLTISNSTQHNTTITSLSSEWPLTTTDDRTTDHMQESEPRPFFFFLPLQSSVDKWQRLGHDLCTVNIQATRGQIRKPKAGIPYLVKPSMLVPIKAIVNIILQDIQPKLCTDSHVSHARHMPPPSHTPFLDFDNLITFGNQYKLYSILSMLWSNLPKSTSSDNWHCRNV